MGFSLWLCKVVHVTNFESAQSKCVTKGGGSSYVSGLIV